MDLAKALRIWRRWWVLTAALLIVAMLGTITVAKHVKSYQAAATVVLLASQRTARQAGGNPYLTFTPSLTLAADAVSREAMAPETARSLAARGFADSYTVALAPFTTATTGSVLLITASGGVPRAVEQTLRAVTLKISAELSQLQAQEQVKVRNRIRVATLAYTPQATLSTSKTARPVAEFAALAILLALGIPVLADAWVARRRARRHAALLPDAGPAGLRARARARAGTRRQGAGQA
jgi:hypothetical protein